MSQQLLLLLTNLIVGGIGAAIAGYIGVRYGMSKLAGERGFTRRVEWYESSINNLQVVIDEIQKVIISTENKEIAEREVAQIVSILDHALPKFVNGAQTYAPSKDI